MKPIYKALKKHLISLVFVALILLTTALYLEPDIRPLKAPNLYTQLDFMDYDDPFQLALLKDLLNLYSQDQQTANDSLMLALVEFSKNEHEQYLSDKRKQTAFTLPTSLSILKMYLNFILIYVLVLAFTYYGVQTLAVWLFVRKQQNHAPFLVGILSHLKLLSWQLGLNKNMKILMEIFKILGRGFGRAIGMGLLFTPAYVTAYSIKSDFNTNSIFFLILLAVLSNGLLITYANKFFTLLIAESRKGYVLTARVKNLDNNYAFNHSDGIAPKAIFRIRKRFTGHVFRHIFMNAQFQYLETIKEQASFVISGLIIIEMALNIHGQFTYELLQQLLNKNFHYVFMMVLGIFVLIKCTDIFVDYLRYKQLKRMD